MLTVLHASDLQCGRPYRPAAADALIAKAEETGPDVIVLSGDLTQRAKRREYALVRSVLDRLPAVATIVTPGNHDVPLFRVLERLFTPYRNWRRSISPVLDTVKRVAGATFVALNSSAPRRALVNGRIDDDQLDFARSAFEAAPEGDVRVLVTHHHFVRVPDRTDGRPLPRARELVASFEAMGVDLVLGGHVHQTHISTSDDLLGERDQPGLPLIACGTTTSWRGRGPEEDLNSLNVIRIGAHEIEVTPHLMNESGPGFEARGRVVLPRRAGSGRSSAPTGERLP